MTRKPNEQRRRSKMRFEDLNAFVDRGISEAELAASTVAVWLVIFRHARPDRMAEVTVETIQAATGFCRRTVFNALTELKQKTMLKVVRRGGLNRGASRYLISPFPMKADRNGSVHPADLRPADQAGPRGPPSVAQAVGLVLLYGCKKVTQ